MLEATGNKLLYLEGDFAVLLDNWGFLVEPSVETLVPYN